MAKHNIDDLNVRGELSVDQAVVPANVTIAYAASVTTDGIEATYTVVDGKGATIAAAHVLEMWVSDDATGVGLTATAASGSLTFSTGVELKAHTAKKHVVITTATTGIAVALLVDSANTAGERFCCINPFNGRIVLGAASVAGDYEGG